MGLPEELSDNSGNLLWQAQHTPWGSTVRGEWQSFDATGRPQKQLAGQTASLQQNLRMQGQYLDRETGLHYNTFRYYDADLGAFTTPDPIGLNGGLNLHQYAPNPTSWIDPWGWACIPNKVSGSAREARVGGKLDGKFGKPNVLRERYLRDANGKIVRDPKTGEARRVDFVVKGSDGKGKAVEVTSKTADKRDQIDKEIRIRAAGGTYVRDPKTKVLIEVKDTSRVIRVD